MAWVVEAWLVLIAVPRLELYLEVLRAVIPIMRVVLIEVAEVR